MQGFCSIVNASFNMPLLFDQNLTKVAKKQVEMDKKRNLVNRGYRCKLLIRLRFLFSSISVFATLNPFVVGSIPTCPTPSQSDIG